MLPTRLDPVELAAKVAQLHAENEHLRFLSRCDHARRQDAERQLSVALYKLEQGEHNDGHDATSCECDACQRWRYEEAGDGEQYDGEDRS